MVAVLSLVDSSSLGCVVEAIWSARCVMVGTFFVADDLKEVLIRSYSSSNVRP